MNVDEALTIVRTAMGLDKLSTLQELVFRGSWEGQSYAEIAHSARYHPDYVKEAGYKLWQSLSASLEQSVNKKNVHSVLGHSKQHLQKIAVSAAQKIHSVDRDWGEAPDALMFIGRKEELDTLKQWVIPDNCRVIVVSGMGGIGKTALAVKLAQQVQGEFQYLIWRSLRNTPSAEQFLSELLEFFNPLESVALQASLETKLSKLMEYLQAHRCLLILDNFESVLESGNLRGDYQEGYQGYGQLLRRVAAESHQSCLLLTSREQPRSITAREKGNVQSLRLGGLKPEEGQLILQSQGIFSDSNEDYRQLTDRYGGNPLALNIVATTIQDLFGNDMTLFLAQSPVLFGDIYDLLEQQFNRLSELEKQVMYWLAIDRDWVSLPKLCEHMQPSQTHRQIFEALMSLQRRSLVEVNSAHFIQQPVVVEYMSEKLINRAHKEIVRPELALSYRR